VVGDAACKLAPGAAKRLANDSASEGRNGCLGRGRRGRGHRDRRRWWLDPERAQLGSQRHDLPVGRRVEILSHEHFVHPRVLQRARAVGASHVESSESMNAQHVAPGDNEVMEA
jgi:hypothetical protein